MDRCVKYAPVAVRIGISLVVLWFGFTQVTEPGPWIRVLPEWTKSLPVGQINLIYLNGWTEIFLGSLLLVGFYTRFVALLVALHLLQVTFAVGYGAVGVRDFGLTLAAVSVFLHGHDKWSIDTKF
ncbi:MAG: DoxX family membrane protein [Candidatus Taylorbacteria bacterium]|nr:DoxX family membrane protein [Candidatus Taylorbacteria bacterium]